MLTDPVVINVRGIPAPKGSYRAILRGGRPIVVPGSSDVGKRKMQSWDRCVRESIAVDLFDGVLPERPLFVERPLCVGIVFRLTRPRGHWGTGKRAGKLLSSAAPMPHKQPDVDKLARSTIDAMTGSIWDDDSRIVELGVVKTYASPGNEGARIVVREWKPA